MYHRIKGRAQYVCSECYDKDEEAERKCFVCSSIFSRKRGVIERKQGIGERKTDGESMSPMLAHLKSLNDKKLAPEEIAERNEQHKQKWLENARKAGILMPDD